MNLLITIAQGKQIELPIEVVCTATLGPQDRQGMGCRFVALDEKQQDIVDEMFATAIDATD
jgi:hypothetical protein